MRYICFNPNYSLKPDNGKVLLIVRYLGRHVIKDIDDSTTNILHPIHAMILSFIDGRNYDVCVNDAARYLGVDVELVKSFVDRLIDNDNEVIIKIGGQVGSVLFPKTVISCKKDVLQKRYSADQFDYTQVDLRITRHFTPTRITLMLNNLCYTDCVYCYEDKTIKLGCQIPFKRITELIHEAYKLNVVTFDVVGGEFFLYPKWKEVLSELRKYDFSPYLSTKMPISEEDVRFLSKLQIHDIQISLDSMIEEHLRKSIKVREGYIKKMDKLLDNLDKYNIPVMLHTVLTKYNDSVEDMKSIFDIIKHHKNIYDWHIVKGSESLYPRKKYELIEISRTSLSEISGYIKKIRETSPFPILYPDTPSMNSNSTIKNQRLYSVRQREDFFTRSYCSGLFSSLYILPTGKVTICEQLYWDNPRFYVGDVLSETLENIWNSDESVKLYNINQNEIPEDSMCRRCKKFYKCRKDRQVCYREIIKKYGKDKWYYPDVNCPYSK